MEGRELRRGMTLSEQLSIVASSSLGELLEKREEDETRRSRCADDVSATLESIMAWEKMEGSAASGGGTGRTLLDIILQEHEMRTGITTEGNSGTAAAWKSLRDLFHLHNAGSATCGAASPGHPRPISGLELVSSSNPDPFPASSDSTLNSEPAALEPAAPAASASEGAADSSAALAAAPQEEEEGSVESSARVSLMALLEQTDWQWAGSGGDGLAQVAAVVEEDEEEMPGDGAVLYTCCVCMVRHKGAAFIPCGHTFCRICSRELWINRGTCPLCNGNISEVLDIF